MTLCERLVFVDGEYPAGTPCEAAPEQAAALTIGPITRLCVEVGALVVVRIGGRVRLAPAGAVQVPRTSSEDLGAVASEAA